MQGMRYFISLLCWLAAATLWGQTPDWQLTLSTGATGYTGASQGPSSAGTFLSSASARVNLTPHLRAETTVHSGGFGLTNSTINRYAEQLTGGQVGLLWHPNWSRQWRINPYVGLGACTFQQTVTADLLDAAGQPYHLWSDGALYDMAEDAPYAQLYAQNVVPDFQPDTEIGTRHTWGVPFRLGIDWQLSDQWTFEAANAWYLGVDPALNAWFGASPASLTAFTVGVGWRPGSRLFQDERIPKEYLTNRMDSDGDGVRDGKDICFNTPVGAPVDGKGCPTDEDGDGVPDYRDAQSGSKGVVDVWGIEVDANRSAPASPSPFTVDYRQIIAEPETGVRPHLPVQRGQQPMQKAQPTENP